MGRKILITFLMAIILVSVAIILFIAFRPQETRDIIKKVSEDKSLASVLPRRPQPKATPVPATPTPEPTPPMEEIVRRIRVRAGDFPFRLANPLNSGTSMIGIRQG